MTYLVVLVISVMQASGVAAPIRPCLDLLHNPFSIEPNGKLSIDPKGILVEKRPAKGTNKLYCKKNEDLSARFFSKADCFEFSFDSKERVTGYIAYSFHHKKIVYNEGGREQATADSLEIDGSWLVTLGHVNILWTTKNSCFIQSLEKDEDAVNTTEDYNTDTSPKIYQPTLYYDQNLCLAAKNNNILTTKPKDLDWLSPEVYPLVVEFKANIGDAEFKKSYNGRLPNCNDTNRPEECKKYLKLFSELCEIQKKYCLTSAMFKAKIKSMQEVASHLSHCSHFDVDLEAYSEENSASSSGAHSSGK